MIHPGCLSHILDYSAGSIRRELLKFQKDNLFITERVGNLLYYSLNTKHPLFRELKGILSKTVGVVGSLRTALSDLSNIELAFIYGSFAAGREKKRNLRQYPECAYNYAYNAMMRMGLGLMFSREFRPKIKDKHLTGMRIAKGSNTPPQNINGTGPLTT